MKKTNSVCGKGSMWGHFGGSRTAGLQKKAGCCQREWLLLRAFFEVSL